MVAGRQSLGEVSALKLRIKFNKYGHLKFIGHLDTMRFFQKLIRRADIDIKYSEGFSPHQIMSFAFPLGVGMCSEGEYVDIEVNSLTSEEDVKRRLNNASVEGVDILKVIILPDDTKNAMASIGFADYRIDFYEDSMPPFDMAEAIRDFYELRDCIPVIKKTKKSTKEIDLKEGILELSVRDSSIFMKVKAASGDNIKPELVLGSLYEFMGFEFDELDFVVTRLELYDFEHNPLDMI